MVDDEHVSKHSFAQITVFITVANSGSITRASEVLDLNPSTISRQISALESRLGIKLFYREGRGLHLTEAGRRAVTFYSNAMSELKKVDALCSPSAQTVRITAPKLYGETQLLPAVSRIQRKYSDIEFDIELCDSVRDFDTHPYDIGFSGGHPLPDSAIAKPLKAIEIVFVCKHEFLSNRASNMLNEEMFKDFTWILTEQQRARVPKAVEKLLGNANLASGKKLFVSDHLTALQSVLAGLGVAGLEKVGVTKFLESGELVNLFGEQSISMGHYRIFYPRGRPNRQEVSKVFHALVKILAVS